MDLGLNGSPTRVLAVEDSSQVGHARRAVVQLATGYGFSEADVGRAALLATELASNILKHAARGALHVRAVQGRGAVGIEIVAVDRGPGFDLARCMADGYSTGGTQGIGLSALPRQAQVFDVYADSRGAVVLVRVYPRDTAAGADCRFGVSHHAVASETQSGDGWRLAVRERQISALVVDGLGHGPAAHDAAQAGMASFDEDAFAAPDVMLARAHQRMAGSRGGALAVASYDGTGTLRFVGIGNVAASLVAVDGSRGLASHPGIVGGQFRTARLFDYPQAGGQLLIMHSDGLQTRWRLSDYPGLWSRHPAVVAAVLHRDFCRGGDDATVLVIALESAHV